MPAAVPSPGPAHAVRNIGRVLVRLNRLVVPAAVGMLALVGAGAMSPAMLLLTVPLPALFAGAMAAVLVPGFPALASARRTVGLAVAAGAVLMPVGAGVGRLGVFGPWVLLALLACILVLLTDRLTGPGNSTGNDLTQLARSVPRLPTGALISSWQESSAALGAATDPARQERVVHLRGVLLDELSRRDPAGVERWLESGDDAPQEHLGTGRNRTW
ncbi:hypothetical protein [Geodermatophilus ruber]|uniref:Uncharacterized protein n=1 Tax=Geodermatophilus ruber TaxID=504800 RepID=A0A1I4AVS3_9ACTN|nr:hypothetical protein [Geodermatophilus ruber]SFK60300.1 hypothetical protein SAMN04488085_102414 [Geodermatophilus ruber]